MDFFPMRLLEFGREQIAHATDDQVPLDGEMLANFKMIQAQWSPYARPGAFVALTATAAGGAAASAGNIVKPGDIRAQGLSGLPATRVVR